MSARDSSGLLIAGTLLAALLAAPSLALEPAEGRAQSAPQAQAPDDAGPRPQAQPNPKPAIPQPNPEALHPDLEMGVIYIGRGQFEHARFVVVDHIERLGDSGKAQFVLGLAFHKEKRYELARPHFEKAIRLDPDYPHTQYFYGYCLFYLGELHKARLAFQAHQKKKPDWADSFFGLGLIDLEENELDAAETNFRKSIELNEKQFEQNPQKLALREDIAKGYTRLSDVMLSRDQLKEAREALEKATSLWPDHYEAWHKLSRVLYRLGDDEAAAAAEKKHDEIRERLHPAPKPPATPGSSGEENS